MPRPVLPPGPGRPKGSQNKATNEAREAIAAFVDGNAHRLSGWLEKVSETNPAKAFELFQSVVEYHIPKLARTEMQALDENGKPSKPSLAISITHVKAES